jgi:hypothetical protein
MYTQLKALNLCFIVTYLTFTIQFLWAEGVRDVEIHLRL